MERNAAVEALGFGLNLSSLPTATAMESHMYWDSQKDEDLQAVKTFVPTSTIQMAEAAAKARARQMKTYGRRLKALDRKKHSIGLPQSRSLVDEESNSASDDGDDEDEDDANEVQQSSKSSACCVSIRVY